MTANPLPHKRFATACKAWALTAALIVAALIPAGFAQEPVRPLTGAPADVTTHHSIRLATGQVAVTATAGTLPMLDSKGEPHAWTFYVAYTKDGAARETRPITFVFNGGPGASSAYLHVGVLGPRIIDFGNQNQLPPPPARLVDNPDTWLDLTDLVFVDPVGSAYSRTVASGDDAGRRYWGVREDVQSLAAVIDLYLKRADRQASPKYIVGESYGGFRAVRLAHTLAADHGIAVSGLFLISPALEFSLIGSDPLALLPDVLRLPSYAAAALERTAPPTPESLVEVERFALGPYLTALAASPRDDSAMKAIHARVADLIGLPESLVARHDGRVPISVFAKELRRPDRLLVSRYDSSMAGPDPYPESSGARGDPMFDGLRALVSGAMADHLAAALGVRTDLTYRLHSGDAFRQWNWRSGLSSRDGYAGSADALRDVLAGNPALKVVVAHGMTDLVTPYMTSRYVIDHLPTTLTAGRVAFRLHAGGHMMYLRAASRAGLRRDAGTLYPAPPL